jgi:two-component system, chemotaxis family, sensor kinase CheA
MNTLRRLQAFFTLPADVSPLERQHLLRTQQVAQWIGLGHIPLLIGVAVVCDTGPLRALVFSLVVLAGPFIAARTLRNPRHVSMLIAVAAMCLGGLLVHFGQGPMQIEMHFYFFAALALLTTFLDPKVVLVGAGTVAVHHLLLYFLLPSSVFNYEASVWVVVVHAAFVVFESFPATTIARRQFDLIVGLERKIDERTAELHQQKARLNQVFDTVEEGLAVIDAEGRWAGPQYAALLRALPNAASTTTFIEAVEAHAPDRALEIAIALEALRDGFLPEELLLEQFPSRIAAGDQTFALRPIRLSDEHRSLYLLVLQNITAELAHAEERRRQNQALALMKRATDDPEAVLSFLRTGGELVTQVEHHGGDLVTTMRSLHTLKGNGALVGLQAFAHLCHELEDEIRDTTAPPSEASQARLRAAWSELEADVAAVLDLDAADDVRIPRFEFAAVLESLEQQIASGVLEQRMRWWSYEPAERPLERLAQQARQIARRVGKEEVEIRVEAGEIRLPAAEWSAFWSALVHVARNAVDHGLHTASERTEVGLSGPPSLVFRTFVEDDTLVVEIADNGPGIAWDALRERAVALGLPSDASDAQVLFADGVTSRDCVTDLSGRGVGLAAVHDAVVAQGGTIEVCLRTNVGTTFRFAFPVPEDAVLVPRAAA